MKQKKIRVTVVGRYSDTGQTFIEYGQGKTVEAARENALNYLDEEARNELDVLAVLSGKCKVLWP